MKAVFEVLFALLHAQFVVGAEGFILADELKITSRANVTSPFNLLENYGDEITTLGPGVEEVRQLLEVFPDLCSASTPAAPVHQQQLAKALCDHMCANVGMGPIFAGLFSLERHFSWHSAHGHEHSVAGMWEATLGAVWRKGCCTLYKHLVSWCSFFCLMSAVVGVDALTQRIASQCFCYSEGREFLASTQEHEFDVLASTQDIVRRAQYWMDACLADIGGTQMVAVNGSVAEIDSGRDGFTRLVCVPSLPPKYFLRLVCYDCHRVHETPLCRHSCDAYVHAANAGWCKPRSSNWVHVRCPDHKNWIG